MKKLVMLDAEELTALADQIADRVIEHLEISFPVDKDRIIGREELAQELGLSVPSIDRMVSDGEIPSFLVKNRRRFNLAKVCEVIENRAA